MALITHNVSTPNDGLGDALRESFVHQNEMNAELYETKVDKIDGKGLSTNDYTNTEKNKLAGIAPFAEVNVQADWLQTDETADDFIKNKPTITSNIANGFISSDTEFADQVFIINAAQWYLNGQLNILEFQFPSLQYPIALADTGLQRIDLFYGNAFGQILRIIGVEDVVAVEPTLPANAIRLTTILSTDTTSMPGTIDVNGFIQKIYSSYSKISNDLEVLPLDGRTNFVIETPLEEFFGFTIPAGYAHDFEGKRYVIRNLSAESCELIPSGADRTFAEAFTLESGKGVEFDVFSGVLKMVGGVGGGGGGGSYTDEQAQDAVGNILTDSSEIDFTYNDGTPSITASLRNNSIANARLEHITANHVKGRLSGNGVVQDIAMADLPISTATQTELNKLTITIELLELQTEIFYAPADLKINSVTNLVGTPSIAILVNDIAYILGTSISQGAKITIQSNTEAVINLNGNYE